MNENPGPPEVNNASIDESDGILKVTLYLHSEAGLAKALGSLDIAKDMVKNYIMMRSVKMQKAQSGIIYPIGKNGGLRLV